MFKKKFGFDIVDANLPTLIENDLVFIHFFLFINPLTHVSSSRETVKLAIEAFQEKKDIPGCETTSVSTDNSTASSDDDGSSSSTLALNSVINITVYCYNGAPMQLKEGEHVDVVFPATIVSVYNYPYAEVILALGLALGPDFSGPLSNSGLYPCRSASHIPGQAD